ncbi:cyclase family protein [Archaeoglobus sp.]|uniref:cyclase family protein n=1 Tax=Archaeoglobus sp. TaxID=1872626 RepID=UPI0025C1BD36|nr:cyclase family protein [Archaeoglobus sp.]
MVDDVDSPYLHGMLDPELIGKPEDILVKPPVKILGKEVEVYDLSHKFGYGVPLWPYFNDVKIDRFHYHAKSRVLSQVITTTMHVSTHADAPIHVEEGFPSIEEVPLERYMGEGVVVSIPKKKWEVITAEDLEKADPPIEKGDIVIVNTGWHRYWSDSVKYFCYAPGFYKEAGEWFVKKKVKAVGIDTQALDHPLATREVWHQGGGDERNAILPWLIEEYKKEKGRDPREDFPYWEPCHRLLLTNGIMGWENVGGDIDKVTGQRCTIIGLPIRWEKGDGSIVRLIAIVEKR